LHFPVKSVVKQKAQIWYTKKTIKYTEMNEREEKPISDALYYDCVKSLMRVPQLRQKAPEWLEESMVSITSPSLSVADQGRNLIQKGWHEIYLDKIQEDGMLEEAKKYHAEQVEARKSRALAQAVLDAPAGQEVQAVSAILSSTAQHVDMNLPQEVRDVVSLEGAWHEAAVPGVPVEKGQSKRRPGNSSRTLHKNRNESRTLQELRQVLNACVTYICICRCDASERVNQYIHSHTYVHTHTHTHTHTHHTNISGGFKR